MERDPIPTRAPSLPTRILRLVRSHIRNLTDGTNADALHSHTASATGAALNDEDFLVGTASGDLSNEIVVGATPGGELGGTWASPTVDSTHSGSAHHVKYTDAEAITAVEGEATLDLAGDVTIDGAKSLSVDVIQEKDSAAGVTVDGLLIKDSKIGDNFTVANANDLTDGGETSLHAHVAILHIVPAASNIQSGDIQYFTTMFKDTTGKPDRIVLVGILSTTQVSVIEYKRLGSAWVFDPADCARDTVVTLQFTCTAQDHITAFSMDSPATSTSRILFIAGNNNDTTDTFEMDSVVLTPGGTSLTTTAVVIAGTNQPTDANDMMSMSIPLADTRAMTFVNDDAHFADISESSDVFTFTYDDAKVLAVDTSIVVAGTNGKKYSGIIIGSQVVLFEGIVASQSSVIWEMSAAAVLTEEFNSFAAGGIGSSQDKDSFLGSAITAIDGNFAMAAPFGGGTTGLESAYIVATFPLDDV